METGMTPFDRMKDAIDDRLLALLPNHGDPADLLTAAMHSAVLGTGKRMRPMLFMSIVHDLGHDAAGLLDLACAIEIVHAASLILDDLPCMGNATLRRGQPAIHLQFGEDVVLLAAVALLSHAFHVLTCADGVSPGKRTHLTRVLARAAGAQGPRLPGVATEMAAIVTHTGAEAMQCLRRFGCSVEQAFQIRDDLLDAGAGAVRAEGDIVGMETDQEAGKATMACTSGTEPDRLRMARAVQQADAQLQQALGPHNRTRGLLAAWFPHCRLQDTAMRVTR